MNDAEPRATLMDLAQYLAARSVLGFMNSFPIEANLSTAAAIGRLVYRLNRKRRQRATEHVRWCFPRLPDAEVERIVVRSYEHMIQLFLVDSIAAPRRISADAWPRYIELTDLGPVIDLLLHGQGLVMLTGHCGNWELLACLLAALGYPVHALARPIDNPLINRWLLGIREARGTRIITKWGAIPVVQDVVRRGGRAAFIADQNAGDQGLFVPFFGRLASTYKSIALLAIRYRVPVVAGGAFRISHGFQYRLTVSDIIRPEEWEGHEDPIFYITARYNRAIEVMVRSHPEQYLWIHRRWKSRPRFEREGRPFPDRLRAKLESLPWMTPSELSRIIESSGRRSDEPPDRMDSPPSD